MINLNLTYGVENPDPERRLPQRSVQLERSPSSRFYCVRGFYSRWAMDLVMQHMDAGGSPETFSMPFGKAERRHTEPSNLKRVPCASADPCLPYARSLTVTSLCMYS